jgi:16S rRNA (guanine966-N2)-methyltransferase
MRIVGGRLRGRRLEAPPGTTTRPTIDRVRESLFNIIESRYRDRLLGGRVGDLYAGTGALGLEALSRGAAHATFIEQSPAAYAVLRRNIAGLGVEAAATPIRGDALAALARAQPFDILFLDPPYGGEVASRTLAAITTYKCIKPGGIIILESGRADMVDAPAGLETVLSRDYGSTRIAILTEAGSR